LIITSQDPAHLPSFLKQTSYTGAAINDTENILAKEFKKRGWLDIAITEKSGYANGMAQPGVLVVGRDGGVKFSWAIVPGLVCLFLLFSFSVPVSVVGGDED
jgi:hypothetical protein